MRPRSVVASALATLSVFSLVSLAGAQQRAATPQKDNGLSRSDRSFIQKASEGGHAEVELGRLAQEKAMSDAVKQFGRRMAEDHSAAGEELKQLASSKGVQVEDKAGKHERTLEKLSRLQANQFDREYVKAMVKDHKNDVAEFRKMSREAKDPELKAWVKKTLPTLEGHLKTIEGIQAHVLR